MTDVDATGERVAYLGTGIADLRAAKRYLKRKFRQAPLPAVQHRPGARFYVTARDGIGRTAFLLGPYVSHMTALANVGRAENLVRQNFPISFHICTFGTASLPTTAATKFGR